MKLITIINIVLLILSLHLKCRSQDIISYYKNLHKANILGENGKCDSALVIFEEEFSKFKFNHTHLIKKALKTATECKNEILVTKYKNIIESNKKCPKKYEKVLILIDSIHRIDKGIRLDRKNKKALKYYRKYFEDTVKQTTLKYKIAKERVYKCRETDSLNAYFLLTLFNKYGYLGESELGHDNYFKSYITLLHFDNDFDNSVLDSILTNALLTNKITPLGYANIIDRHLSYAHKPQKYWTWPLIVENPNLSTEDISKILKLRQSIGLFGTELEVSCIKGAWRLNNLSQEYFNP